MNTFGRVRHDARSPGGHEPGVADPGGRGTEPVERLVPRRQQRGRLGRVERGTALGAREGAPDLLGSHQMPRLRPMISFWISVVPP